MVLADHANRESGDLVRPLRIEGVEKDLRPQGAEGNRKEGCGLLVHKRLFDVGMAAVDMDYVSRDGRRVQRKGNPWMWSQWRCDRKR